jgi:cold shock CspA family protein
VRVRTAGPYLHGRRWWPGLCFAARMALANGQAAPIPLQITFRGLDPSQAVETAIRRRVVRLEQFGPQITRLQVTVHMPQQHRHRGNYYAIRIDITTPTGELHVTGDPSLEGAQKDFQSVLGNAFDAATRELESAAQRGPGGAQLPRGRVTRIFPEQSYGFLTSAEGEDVYFNQDSLQGASFAQLSVGSEVTFTINPEDADQGARAASVCLLPAAIPPAELLPADVVS